MNRSMFGILAACVALSACTTVPSGTKNGTITKIAQQGVMNLTYEAEIVRGGSFTGGTGVQGAPFDFTIKDPMLLKQVQDAYNNQREVRITYHKEAFCPMTSDSDCNFLDHIEIVSAAQGGTLARTGQGSTDLTPQSASTPAVSTAAQDTAAPDPRFQALLEQNNAILKQNQALLDKLVK